MGVNGKTMLVILMFLAGSIVVQAENDTLPDQIREPSLNTRRLAAVLATQGVIYAGSMTGLYFLWYADYPQSSFHFFNDNSEWFQMDKAGHVTSAYLINNLGYASYRWAGMERKKAIWYSALLSFAYMANIEILDAFSTEWGFSTGDFIANTSGCLIFTGQQLLWDEQRIRIKYSFHPTKYPDYRPGLLGENFVQQMLKDYNGQTYWLSGNVSSFLPQSFRFPKWINIAAGYGAEGMTGAFRNPDGAGESPVADFTRYRQFYLSMDVDLSRIPTKSKTLHTILSVVNVLKVPFPAIEFNTKGQVLFHPIYF
ncbi:MAG TPA: DUF2279 domain-containing protein [Bacteroidales bacterium]|nr:DUF2279 domain-containing protein [Bacteroidales bacterium]